MHLGNLIHLEALQNGHIEEKYSLSIDLVPQLPNRVTTGCIGLIMTKVRQPKMLIPRQKKCRGIRADELLTPSENRASESDIAYLEGRGRTVPRSPR